MQSWSWVKKSSKYELNQWLNAGYYSVCCQSNLLYLLTYYKSLWRRAHATQTIKIVKTVQPPLSENFTMKMNLAFISKCWAHRNKKVFVKLVTFFTFIFGKTSCLVHYLRSAFFSVTSNRVKHLTWLITHLRLL